MLINEILKIKYPIIQGAMANITLADFASTVSNAGGLGIIATGGLDPNQTRYEIQKCKKLTDKPFGVNVMLMNPFVDEIIEVILEEGVAVVTTGAGNPAKYIPALKEKGIKVFPVVASVALAIRMARLDIDGLIVEGCESGGHVGQVSTMTLLPQVTSKVSLPIIGAGGIGDGRGLVAALALGACGVQIGTVLLASLEVGIHENYKQAVIKARETDTLVTGTSLNAPVRILKNKMAKSYLQLERQLASRDELELLTMGALKKAVFDGDVENGSVMMGQIAGMVKEIKPVGEIFEEMMKDCINQINCLYQLQGDINGKD